MGRRSINTTKSGKFMNPTDQARTFYKTYNYGFAFAVFTEGRNADVSDVGKMRGYLLVPGLTVTMTLKLTLHPNPIPKP